MRTLRRAAVATLAGVSLVLGSNVAVRSTRHVTFGDPGPLPAGSLTLRGSVSTDLDTDVTSVVYVVDVSDSTRAPFGRDCDGDGVAGGPGDNSNGDGTVG